MRAFFFSLLILVWFPKALQSQANNVIRGIITIQNSSAQPAANVQVTAFGANPVFTNSAGQFELKINGGKPGQTVMLIVQKESYQVLGPDPMVYETAVRDNPNDLIRIVIANAQAFQERVDKFMGSIDKRIREQNQSLKELREAQEGNLSEAEKKQLTDQLASLYKQIAELEQSKEELAKQLAAIDLDQASAFAKEAIEKFENGEPEAAIALMDKEKLDEYYETVLAQEEKLEKARKQAVENYMVLARMQRANLQYQQAIATYQEAIFKDSSNVDNLLELGKFLTEIQRDIEGLDYFLKALDYSRDELQSIDILTTVGGIVASNYLPKPAEMVLLKADSLARKIGEPAIPQQIKILTSLGFLRQTQGLLPQAEAYLLQGISLCQPLFEADRELYFESWANLEINRSLLYLMAGNFEKASEIALDVFTAYEETPGERTPEQRLALGYLLNNMGHGLAQAEVYDVADTLFRLAESVCLDLEGGNRQIAKPLHSLVLNNLGMGLYNRGEFEQAVPFLDQSLAINIELSELNPLRFQPMVGLTSGNLAMAEYNLGRFESSGAHFTNAFLVYAELSQINPEAFLPMLAQVKENHLSLVSDTQPLDTLIKAQFEYIGLLKELESAFPGQFGEKTAYFYGETAWNQVLAKEFENAVETAKMGLEIDPAQNWIYSVLAPALLLSGNEKAAIEIYSARKEEIYSLDETQTLREVFLEDIETLIQEGNKAGAFTRAKKAISD